MDERTRWLQRRVALAPDDLRAREQFALALERAQPGTFRAAIASALRAVLAKKPRDVVVQFPHEITRGVVVFYNGVAYSSTTQDALGIEVSGRRVRVYGKAFALSRLEWVHVVTNDENDVQYYISAQVQDVRVERYKTVRRVCNECDYDIDDKNDCLCTVFPDEYPHPPFTDDDGRYPVSGMPTELQSVTHPTDPEASALLPEDE